jgi:hypothetical protein
VAGELIPYRPPDEDEPGSQRFLRHARVWERLGARVELSQLGFAAACSGALVLLAGVAAGLPSPGSIRHGGFALVAAGGLGGLAAFAKALAGPLLIVAVVFLLGDLYVALRQRCREGWHVFVAVQPFAAAGAALPPVLVLAGLAVNLVIWTALIIVIGALALAALGIVGAVLNG